MIMSKNEDKLSETHSESAATAADLRALLVTIGENIWDWNLLTDEVFFSPGYQDILGFTPGEFGHHIDEWIKRLHPEDAKRAMQAMRSCLDGKAAAYQDEHRVSCRDGSWKWLRARGAVVARTNDHRPARIVCLMTDITDEHEHKNAEQTALHHEELLRQSGERYKQLASELEILISNSPVGVMFVSDGKIIRANKTLADLCRFKDVQDMIGIKSTFLYQDEADYQAFSAVVIPKLIADELVDVEWRVNCIDGTSFLARIVGKAMTSDLYVRGAVWMLEDITERHRINKLKSEFISVVSHELRTPLTSIRGSLGLLEAGLGGTLPEKALRLIKIAHDNSRRLVGLVNDILDMEKLASGKMQFKSERLDLVAVVADAIEANTAYAVALNVRLQLFNHPDQAWVLGDPDRLMQVLANFLSNASKFSPKGDVVRLQIFTETEQEKIHYKVEVTDVGAGIPLAFQTRIFEPFSQADGTDSRQQGGTGLGLSITKSYIEKMHGKIGFISAPDKGSSFWFSLPAVE
jgi:PAS domain S-box-containing protein